jgi:outer membrane protein assembly factor BamB
VFALDPADGTVLWRHSAPGGKAGLPPVLSGGLVQALSDSGRRLEALDPDTGEVRWRREMSYTGIWQAGGALLLGRADGTVTGVDGASGGTLWHRSIPGHAAPFFLSFPGDPSAYVASASRDGSTTRVTAVDPATGSVRWDARLDGALEPFASAGGSLFLLSLDTVYGDTKAVVRYTPASGATRRVPLSVPRQNAQGTAHGGVVHLLAAGGGLEAVDLDAGRRLWQVETSVSLGSAPVTDGRRVYLSTADGRLLAFDARRGTFLGQTRPRLGARADRVTASVSAPVLVGGRVCAGAPDGTVFAVDGRDPAAW